MATASPHSRSGAYGLALKRARLVALTLGGFVALLWAAVACFPAPDSGFTLEKERFNADTLYQAVQLLFANGSTEMPTHQVVQVLRLVAPAVLTLLALLTFLSAFATRSRLAWLRWVRRPLSAILGRRDDLVVIIGLGYKGLERAKAALSSGSSSVVVLESDESNAGIVEVQSRGGLVWVGNAMNRKDLRTVFWKRPRKVWIMTGDSRSNLIVLNEVRRVLLDSRPGFKWSDKGRVDIYACVKEFDERRDASSLHPLNADTEDVWTHVFNHEETVAAWVVHKHPVRTDAGGVPRVLVIGLGLLGRAVIRELMLVCHFPESRRNLHRLACLSAERADAATLQQLGLPEIVAVDSAQTAHASLIEELPFLRDDGGRGRGHGVLPFIASRLHLEDAQQWVFEDYRERIRAGARFTHVFIALGSEVRNVAVATRLWAWEKTISGAGTEPPWIVPILYEPEAREWDSIQDARSRLRPLVVEDAYAEGALQWDENVREMGQRINKVYDALYPSGTPKDWTSLLEHDRRSSLAQARYVFNRWYEQPGEKQQAGWSHIDPSQFDDEAECEHRRWCAFQLVENVGAAESGLPGYGLQVQLVSDDSSRTAPQRDRLRKWARVHNELLPFDRVNQDKDLAFVLQHPYIKTEIGSPVGLEDLRRSRNGSS
jgi:hypothetical protein